MTESADQQESLLATRVEAARTAIAVQIARRLGLPFGGISTAPGSGPQLSLSPYWPLGYELDSELLVLESISKPEVPTPGAVPSQNTLTSADFLLSQTAAFLFDKLVNPVLPLQRVAPQVGDLVPLNTVYDEVLRRAKFAGSVLPTSPVFLAAAAQLFDNDNQGGRTETAAYREYLDFNQKARESQDAVDAAPAGDADRAVAERDRVLAEWVVRGHRGEIEAAIRVILEEERTAGFQDERRGLLDRIGAGRRSRIDAPGFSYFPARLVPISPLLDPVAEPSGWTSVEIDATELRDLLSADGEPHSSLAAGASDPILDGFSTLKFEFLVCDVVREWLDERFFEERFWRLAPGELLSDGVGGGRLPGYAASLVFIRRATVSYSGSLAARFNTQPGSPPGFPVRMIRIVSTERAPRRLEPVRSLAAARDLDLPLALAMLKTVERGSVVSPIQIRPQTVGATTIPHPGGHSSRLNLDGVTVHDHRLHPDLPKLLSPTTRVLPMRVSVTSLGEPIDGISVEVEAPNSRTQRPKLVGGPNSVAGTAKIAAPPGGKTAALVVRLFDQGRLLDQQVLTIGSKPVDVHWSVAAEPVTIELTSASVPTLFAYLVKPVTKCPDPDENLSWE